MKKTIWLILVFCFLLTFLPQAKAEEYDTSVVYYQAYSEIKAEYQLFLPIAKPGEYGLYQKIDAKNPGIVNALLALPEIEMVDLKKTDLTIFKGGAFPLRIINQRILKILCNCTGKSNLRLVDKKYKKLKI